MRDYGVGWTCNPNTGQTVVRVTSTGDFLDDRRLFRVLSRLISTNLWFRDPSCPYSYNLKDRSVKAKVGKYHVDALPDTGAQCNLISSHLAEKAGLVPSEGTQLAIRLPTGKQVLSSGSVKIPFSFLGEANEYMLEFWVIPGCKSDLILSRRFLDATETLTKFTHRITTTTRKEASRYRLNLLGDEFH